MTEKKNDPPKKSLDNGIAVVVQCKPERLPPPRVKADMLNHRRMLRNMVSYIEECLRNYGKREDKKEVVEDMLNHRRMLRGMLGYTEDALRRYGVTV